MDLEAKKLALRKLRQELRACHAEHHAKESRMAQDLYDFCKQNGGHHVGITDAEGDGFCEDCDMDM